MKSFFPALLILAFALKLSADQTNSVTPLKIGTGDAGKFYDQEMTVTGKVAQVSFREKVVILNLDQPFPESPFSVVVFSTATNQFGDLKALDGKNVEVKGKIKKYKDKPEIVLDKPSQLKVLGSTNTPAK